MKMIPYQADGNTCQFVPGKGLVIKQEAYKNKGNGKETALDYISCAYLPPCLIGVNPAYLKPHYYKAENKRCPVQLGIFLEQVAIMIQNKIENRTDQSTHKVSDSQ